MQRLSGCRIGRRLAFFILLIGLLSFSSLTFAQTTGMISGTITDQTGAVVPKAKVTLINPASNDTRRATSNAEGYFVFTAVPAATYSVKVEAAGFKTWEVTSFILNPSDRKHVSAQMEVGTSAESVTVEATAAAIAFVDSGERGAVLSSKDIANLSLVGRDVTELLRTLPGFNNYAGGGGISNQAGYDTNIVGISSAVGRGYNANGNVYRGGTDLTSDGAHVLDPGCNCNSTQTINADMVQEIKVQTSNFGADNVKGPVVVSAISKSGTQDYHGSLYLDTRNSIFNSNDWNYNHNKVKKTEDRYYYPGASFGGPVKIPGTHFNSSKKLLFWTGFEYYNQQFPFGGGLLQTKVPTDSMRSGNFSLAATDNALFCSLNPGISACNAPMNPTPDQFDPSQPWVGTHWSPFANAQIPTSTMDAGGLALMKMIPQANVTPSAATGGANYVKSIVESRNGLMFHSKVDFIQSDNTKFYVSYNYQKDTGQDPVMLWWTPGNSVPYPGNVQEQNRSHTISANFVRVFSPTMTNEAVFALGYAHLPMIIANPQAVSKKALGYPYKGVFKNGNDQMPAMEDWGNAGYPQFLMLGYLDNQLSSTKRMPSFTDTMTKVWRTHTVKTGFFWEQTGNNSLSPGPYTQGKFSFVSDWSYFWNTYNNHGTNNSIANMLMGYAGGYTEANKISENDMAYNTFGGFISDDWKATKRLTLQLGVRFDHLGTWYDKKGTGIAVWDAKNYAADLAAKKYMPGISWHALNSSIPTSGRSVPSIFISPRFGMSYDLFGNGKTMLRGGFGAYRWRDSNNSGPLSTALGLRSVDLGSVKMSEIDSRTVPAQGGIANDVWAVSPYDHAQPVTYNYNFTISQAMPADSVLEIAYVGNQSHFLDTSNIGDRNLGNVNRIPMGAYFRANPSTGVVIDDPGAANKVKDQYRPYCGYSNGACQGFGNLIVVNHNGWANYNGLQITWNKVKGWFTYGANYTYSKALGINTDSDPTNINNDYGPVSIDRTHAFNLNYQLTLGNRYRGAHRILRGAANGWMFSGILSLQSGPNIQAVSPSGFNLGLDPAGYNRWSLLGTDNARLMPVITCDPKSVSGEKAYVNPACFSVETRRGQNGWYQMPYMHGPAFMSNDMTLMKSFKLTERQNVEFRVAAFNVFNHPLTSFNQNDTTALALKMIQNNSGQWVVQPNSAQPFGVAPIKYGRRTLKLSVKYTF